MTLKEKFKDVIEDAITHDQQYDSFEQIADEFAIGFAEWCLKNGLFTQFKITQRANKELLEIYKKERGL